MVSIFKCTEVLAALSLMLVCQSWGFTSRYFHVLAATETLATDTTRPSDPAPQISVLTVTITATPSSAAPSSAPISSNITASSTAVPTSTYVPIVPTLTAGV